MLGNADGAVSCIVTSETSSPIDRRLGLLAAAVETFRVTIRRSRLPDFRDENSNQPRVAAVDLDVAVRLSTECAWTSAASFSRGVGWSFHHESREVGNVE